MRLRGALARRPLLISVRRPLAFFSGDAFFMKPKGSYLPRRDGAWAGAKGGAQSGVQGGAQREAQGGV